MRAVAALAAVAVLAALALPASAPASWLVTTDYEVALAGGEGRTTCLISKNISDYPFSDWWGWEATTDCDVPVQMFTEAWWHGGTRLVWEQYSGPCDGVRDLCELGGGDQGEFQGGSVRHHVKLRAPLGQGWFRAPTGCSGVGTDNLECWFGT